MIIWKDNGRGREQTAHGLEDPVGRGQQTQTKQMERRDSWEYDKDFYVVTYGQLKK